MRIVKNVRDLSLNEDEKFFAEIIKDEFDCNTCEERVKNKEFLQSYAQPLNDFTIYTTAQPTAEGIRMVGWRRCQPKQA